MSAILLRRPYPNDFVSSQVNNTLNSNLRIVRISVPGTIEANPIGAVPSGLAEPNTHVSTIQNLISGLTDSQKKFGLLLIGGLILYKLFVK